MHFEYHAYRSTITYRNTNCVLLCFRPPPGRVTYLCIDFASLCLKIYWSVSLFHYFIRVNTVNSFVHNAPTAQWTPARRPGCLGWCGALLMQLPPHTYFSWACQMDGFSDGNIIRQRNKVVILALLFSLCVRRQAASAQFNSRSMIWNQARQDSDEKLGWPKAGM